MTKTTTTTTGTKAKKRPGVTPEMMYSAKKRAITMMAAVAVNPPGQDANVSVEESEEIAFRCLSALAKLAQGDSAYLVLIHGGPRASIDCLRLYLHNVDVTYASFKVIRGLLQNPSTMMKFRKQKRFRIIPATVMDGVYRHENLDIKAEAAHTLWTYAAVGGYDAQELVISVEFLPVIKAGLEEAREIDSGGDRVRKFVGCVLALAKENPAIQDLLVKEGMRGMVRKCLVENPSISFHGEFTDLRDWIRGDRGGAKSAVDSRVRRDQSAERREKNLAETTLARGMEEHGPKSHAEAARYAKSPAHRRVGAASSSHHQHQQQTTTTTTTFTSHEEHMDQRRDAFRKGGSGGGGASGNFNQIGKGGGIGDSATFTVAGGGSKGGSWSISEAIQVLNSDNREVHSEASEALAEMFAASPPTGVEILMKGGVGAITNAVDASHAAFAAGGMALLHMFAASEVTSRRMKSDDQVLNGRCVTVILTVMRRYPRNTAVIQWGAMCLWALSKDNPRCKLAIMAARIPGGGTSGDVLMDALTTHGKTSEAVAKALLGCMLTLATNSKEWQEGWTELSAPALIMRTLEAHRGISFKGEFDSLRGWLRDNV